MALIPPAFILPLLSPLSTTLRYPFSQCPSSNLLRGSPDLGRAFSSHSITGANSRPAGGNRKSGGIVFPKKRKRVNLVSVTQTKKILRRSINLSRSRIKMVLPLLPVVTDFNDLNSQSGSLTKNGFTAIGQVMFQGHVNELSAVLDRVSSLSTKLDIVVDIEGLSVDQSVQLLDSGAAKIVVTKSQLPELIDIPPERLIVRMTEDQVATPAGIEDIASSIAGIILDSSFTRSIDPESLKSIVNSLRKSYLPTGGERTVYLQYSATTPQPPIAELKSLALLSIEPIIMADHLTSSPKDHSEHLSVAQIALLGAKTDRPDGLYSTVVVDERGHALGLVYSSVESIAETIKTGTGVYQSRQRGLWYKGATSGATQEIISMSWDCDADCLCYTVKQAGKGTFLS